MKCSWYSTRAECIRSDFAANLGIPIRWVYETVRRPRRTLGTARFRATPASVVNSLPGSSLESMKASLSQLDAALRTVHRRDQSWSERSCHAQIEAELSEHLPDPLGVRMLGT
jgi:hypothetical protein